MSDDQRDLNSTIALSTKLEEDFVSPLTAVRGALEILRDFPDLARSERTQFVETALRGCLRLEAGIRQLAKTVYDDRPRSSHEQLFDREKGGFDTLVRRIHFFDGLDLIEIDFTDMKFTDSKMVNNFYDFLETLIEGTHREWYFMVNYRGCAVWPEAWVAFAHRGKKINSAYSLGTVRYVEQSAEESPDIPMTQLSASDPDFFETRDTALARIEEMKRIRAMTDRVD
jgi:hypothetical protein